MSTLNHKPLIEAIFEMKWELTTHPDGSAIDPYYQILIGQYFNVVKDKFPHWNKLPAAEVPVHIVPHVAQHQFRKVEGGWPLIQIGSGLLTVNDTDEYDWDIFKEICKSAIEALYSVYPNAKTALKINHLSLRYLDADLLHRENISDFLKKMKVTTTVPEALFSDSKVLAHPIGLNLQLAFISNEPKGIAHLKFSQGKKNKEDAVIWETSVVSTGEQVPELPQKSIEWLEAAHSVTSDWFIKLTEGELMEKYK